MFTALHISEFQGAHPKTNQQLWQGNENLLQSIAISKYYVVALVQTFCMRLIISTQPCSCRFTYPMLCRVHILIHTYLSIQYVMFLHTHISSEVTYLLSQTVSHFSIQTVSHFGFRKECIEYSYLRTKYSCFLNHNECNVSNFVS